jgi:hypothetical protein
MRVQVVLNESGTVIAAAHVGAGGDEDKQRAGFYPLTGQQIVELDVPPALMTMEPHDRLRAILEHRVDAADKRLEPLARK